MIYLAEDCLLRRQVAIKKLHPHLLNRPEAVERFEKEALAIARISHENIIKIFDVGREEGRLFLAMEYVDGLTLEGMLEGRTGALPNLVALELFHQLALGLAAAHGSGIYHRDLKPSNILVDKNGCVRIADFGVAFLGEKSAITRTGSLLGTPQYASPEQAEGRPADGKSDVFSLGVVLFRCLTGSLPFSGHTVHATLRAILDQRPPRPDRLNPRILPGLPELLEKMLAKHSNQRPEAWEVASAVEEIAEKLKLHTNKKRVLRYLASPASSEERETLELHSHFAEQARRESLAGRQVQAWKDFSRAALFMPLSAQDRAHVSLLGRKRRKAGALIAVGTALTLGVLAAGMGMKFAAYRIPPPAAAFPLPEEPRPALRVPPPAAPLSAPAAAVLPAGNSPSARPARRAKPAPAPVAPVPAAKAELAPPPCSLMVRTNPPYVTLYLDGALQGETPLASPLSAAPGSHVLRLEKEGCAPESRQVVIRPGENLDLRISLRREEGKP